VSSSITKEVCFEGMEYPYVKEVSMYADDGTGSTLIYHGVWEDLGDCIFFEKETYPYNLSAMATASVTVDVVTSKPFSDLIMALSGTIIELAGSDENWTGLIPAGFFEEQVSNGSIYQPIFFQGQDMEGNPLMELNSMSTSMVQCVIVPEWTAACTWEPAPVISPNGDQVHVLEMHCEWVDFALDVSEGTISLVYNETPIKVLWTGPGITPQNMYNFVVENAEFGQYCATVLFANGCALNKCLIFPGQMLLIPEYTSPCPGMSDGSICVNVYGGSGAYALTWQSGSTGNCLTGLEPGDGDCLTVVDLVYGEVVQECFDVPVFEPPMIELASLDPPCPDGTGGQICVNVSGSNPPFMVEWPGSGAMGFCNETLQDGELICAVVTDGCGVEVEECFPAPAYSGMQVSNLEVVHPIENCPNGMISFDIAGGIPPYSVSWTSEVLGGTLVTEESELTNLPAGYYEIAVSDACGFTTFPFYVQLNGTQPAYTILAHVGNITHVCSQDDESGSIDLNVSSTNDGVLGDLNYQWSNGATTQDISNLLPGTYSVTVTDPNTGCSYTASATVESKAIDPAWFYYSFILPSCANEATGSIFLNPISKYGQGTFSFLWSNGETGRYPQHLPAGTNTVTITNQYGCYTEMTFEVGEVASPEIMLTELQHAYTEGESNGKISVTAKGSNFTYQWSNGGVGSTISDLPVGTYTVTVTNSMGCSSQATFKIDYCIVVYAPGLTWENFTYIQLSRTVTQQSAPGAADGAIDLTITQGSAPIYYYWTGPGGFKSNAQDISGLEEGKYCATVTNGCDEVNFCEWVVNCDDFEVELTVTQNGSQEGICWTPCSSPIKVTATVSNYHGALDMMEYEWEFIGEENPLVGNSSTRTFSWDNLNAVNWANLKITVTDEAGCSKSTTINLFNFAEFPSSENNFVFNYLSQNQPGEADALQYFLTAAEGYEHTLPGYIIGCGFNYYCDGELVCSDGLVANSCTTSSGTSCNCPAAEGALGVFSCGGANSIGVQHIATYVEQLPNCEVKYYCLYLSLSGNETFVLTDVESHPGDCDGDGWPDNVDNCPDVINPLQEDSDVDGIGDACDNCPIQENIPENDTDNDGWPNLCDHCPESYDILNPPPPCPPVAFGPGGGGSAESRTLDARPAPAPIHEIRIHPNPTTGHLNLRLYAEKATTLRIRLRDPVGQDIQEQPFEALPGHNEFEWILPEQLPAGLYYIQVQTPEGEQHLFRVVLIR
jgi:hypothetical protein